VAATTSPMRASTPLREGDANEDDDEMIRINTDEQTAHILQVVSDQLRKLEVAERHVSGPAAGPTGASRPTPILCTQSQRSPSGMHRPPKRHSPSHAEAGSSTAGSAPVLPWRVAKAALAAVEAPRASRSTRPVTSSGIGHGGTIGAILTASSVSSSASSLWSSGCCGNNSEPSRSGRDSSLASICYSAGLTSCSAGCGSARSCASSCDANGWGWHANADASMDADSNPETAAGATACSLPSPDSDSEPEPPSPALMFVLDME
jgi:hypothetical protein